MSSPHRKQYNFYTQNKQNTAKFGTMSAEQNVLLPYKICYDLLPHQNIKTLGINNLNATSF